MPRPHYPAQGGPHISAWNAAYARLPRRAELFAPPVHEDANNPVRSPGTTSANGQAVPPFVPPSVVQMAQERSRSQTAATQTQVLRDTPKTGVASSVHAAPNNLSALPEGFFKRHGVVWLAAALCAIAVVFAFLAICWHG